RRQLPTPSEKSQPISPSPAPSESRPQPLQAHCPHSLRQPPRAQRPTLRQRSQAPSNATSALAAPARAEPAFPKLRRPRLCAERPQSPCASPSQSTKPHRARMSLSPNTQLEISPHSQTRLLRSWLALLLALRNQL